MSFLSNKDSGSLLRAESVVTDELTAGVHNDGTEFTGPTIDREGFSSGALVISGACLFGDGPLLCYSAKIQESTDGVIWGDDEVLFTDLVVIDQDDPGDDVVIDPDTENRFWFSHKVPQLFSHRYRYVRYKISASFHGQDFDTADWSSVLLLGGAFEVPVN